MVCAGLPEDAVALHSLVSAKDILEGIVQGMPHMKGTGHIGRRDYDTEWFPVSPGLCPKQVIFFPIPVPLLFHFLWLITFG